MKVRVNSRYVYQPVGMDKFDPPYGIEAGILREGEIVKVVNKYGCPPANTMGHCYINNQEGEFCGLVCTQSLVPIGDAVVLKGTVAA